MVYILQNCRHIWIWVFQQLLRKAEEIWLSLVYKDRNGWLKSNFWISILVLLYTIMGYFFIIILYPPPPLCLFLWTRWYVSEKTSDFSTSSKYFLLLSHETQFEENLQIVSVSSRFYPFHRIIINRYRFCFFLYIFALLFVSLMWISRIGRGWWVQEV